MKDSDLKQTTIFYGALLAGSIVITAFCDYLFQAIKNKNNQPKIKNHQKQGIQQSKSIHRRQTIISDKILRWGELKLKQKGDDPITKELSKMATLANQIERVDNIIVDLGLDKAQLIPNPIVAYKSKLTRDDPFLDPKALVEPLSFVLNTPEIKSAQMNSFVKKWLRAGPRSHIYFKPQQVRAAIVSMGGVVPGINVVIKQLVYVLQEVYGVKQIYGIKHSFESSRRQKIKLTCQDLKTIHHYGGSILGIHRSDISPIQIADRLATNNINQLYVIGGPGTIRLANQLRQTIKNKKLNLSFCVIPKQMTNAIPITERSIGFETALQESQKMIESGYTEAHAHDNGVSIVKIAGKQSGYLAVQTCLASRNIEACLVPQFPFQLYGQKGLLAFIHKNLIERSHCTLVVTQGCSNSILDYDPPIVGNDWDGTPVRQDINKIIKLQLQRYLAQRNTRAVVKTIDTYEIRASIANAKQTALCSKYAAQSVHCVMSGYTNFIIGSITNRTVMIPIQQVISGDYSDQMIEYCDYWTRLLLMTSQPSFRNNQ